MSHSCAKFARLFGWHKLNICHNRSTRFGFHMTKALNETNKSKNNTIDSNSHKPKRVKLYPGYQDSIEEIRASNDQSNSATYGIYSFFFE
jgi:hypothetical protein